MANWAVQQVYTFEVKPLLQTSHRTMSPCGYVHRFQWNDHCKVTVKTTILRQKIAVIRAQDVEIFLQKKADVWVNTKIIFIARLGPAEILGVQI